MEPLPLSKIPEPVIGMVDVLVPPATLHGWARQPDGPVTLVARQDGTELGRATAILPRSDLTQHALGDCAFELVLDRPVSPVDLASGRLGIWAEAAGLPPVMLPLSPGLQPPAMPRAEVPALVAALDALDAATLMKLRLAARPGGMAAQMLDVMATAFGAGWAARALAAQEQPAETRVSWLPLPVGLVSGDGAATLGRDGWIFLTGGANQVRQLYPPHASAATEATGAAAWAALFRARQAACVARGLGFAQLIIPEKLSLLPDYLAEPVETPSGLLAALEPLLAGLGEAYIPGLYSLRAARREAAFRKLDSHLSPYGSWLLASAVLRGFGLMPGSEPKFASRGRLVGGDLTMRFFGVPMAEPVAEADPASLTQPLLVEDLPAPAGEHLGSRRAWRNPAAPVDERLLVLGNSFAHPDGQDGLAWWLAQQFREVHFTWTPALDWDEVARVRPDRVLCQTVERYLPALPPA